MITINTNINVYFIRYVYILLIGKRLFQVKILFRVKLTCNNYIKKSQISYIRNLFPHDEKNACKRARILFEINTKEHETKKITNSG